MGNAESMPVVSQAISAGQAIVGDHDGARRTQEQFSRECPIVSQVRSLVEVSMGDSDAALRTQMQFAMSAQETVEKIPGIGHASAAIQDALGDHAGASRALHRAHLTTAPALAGLALGGVAAGRIGAIVGASAGGVAGAQSATPFNLDNRAGWIRFQGQDADCGQNATTLFANNLIDCQRFAEENRYGGFAVWNSIAYFRSARGAELRGRLCAAPVDGVTFYIFEAPAQRGVQHEMQVTGDVHAPRRIPRSEPEVGSVLPRSRSVPALSRRLSLSPLNIFFTHDEISDAFRPRDNEPGQPLDFPPIVVVQYQNKFYSLSNRRLFVFRVLAVRGVLPTVPVQLEEMEGDLIQQMRYDDRLGRQASWWDQSFTTRNGGQTVRVRGRGSVFARRQQISRDDTDEELGPDRSTERPRRSGKSRQRIAAARRRYQNTSPEPVYDRHVYN